MGSLSINKGAVKTIFHSALNSSGSTLTKIIELFNRRNDNALLRQYLTEIVAVILVAERHSDSTIACRHHRDGIVVESGIGYGNDLSIAQSESFLVGR